MLYAGAEAMVREEILFLLNEKGFNFGKSDEWPIWFKRYQRYRIASGLSEKSENEQVNALVYFMGDKAE
ncbi:hypothetical protein LAZ67_1006972 [Cordylochernes scorpioides]|uniref:Uncharacterized protein n=1 Tax=Cordylochernes scorpioides TaxID=51811 RepID=A0ABY6K0S2_9ARAC|nr:hypothetical protein LAZ67_1006972 [Cordylochernes scorpioides]